MGRIKGVKKGEEWRGGVWMEEWRGCGREGGRGREGEEEAEER